MREIEFRGKDKDTGKWFYGSLIDLDEDGVFIALDLHERYEVDRETIGQYTGLKDMNGVKIFEGDILKAHYANTTKDNFIETVVFKGGKFVAEYKLSKTGRAYSSLWDGVRHFQPPYDRRKDIYMDYCKVIGNIHDNPELLEEKPE